jgi:hypothetical protein
LSELQSDNTKIGSLVKQKKRESKYLKIKTRDNKKKIYEHHSFLENNKKKEKAIEEDGGEQGVGVDLTGETIPGGSRELDGDAHERSSIRNENDKVPKDGGGSGGGDAKESEDGKDEESGDKDSGDLEIELADSVSFFPWVNE